MNLFYMPQIQENNDIENWLIDLSAEEAKHAIKVLRLSIDDQIFITNGKGMLLKTRIIAINKKQCVVKVLEVKKEWGKRDYRIHIAVAPTKNIKRFEWFLEKATEMGIDEITPLLSFHSERSEIKYERENKVITSAVKQSLKAYHPILNGLCSFKDFMLRETEEELFIAHLIDEKQLLLRDACPLKNNICILIGPEGDFSKEELQMAIEKGYKAVSLGNTRLRTETAALAACFTVNMLNL